MPWPEPLAPLLARSDSHASQALRWGLHGLRATLQAAAAEVPHDPGCDQLRALVAELDRLFEPAGGPTAELPLAADSEVEAAPSTLRLLPLAEAAAADSRFRAELQRSPLRQGSDEEIWNELQRLLLRVSPALAEEWRRRSL